jgi:copper chaperone CopZ
MRLLPAIALVFFVLCRAHAADGDSEVRAPHTPTLIFYLSGANGPKDVEAIRSQIRKLKTASTIEVNTDRSYARVRFDSHVVSYHQVAQAIVDAGKGGGKTYDPYLIFSVTGYSETNNAEKWMRFLRANV